MKGTNQVTSTTEVMLRTADLEDARAFYSGALGFPIVMDSQRVIGFNTGGFNSSKDR